MPTTYTPDKSTARQHWDRMNSSKVAAQALYHSLVDAGLLSPAARVAARTILDRWDAAESSAWNEWQALEPAYEVSMIAHQEGNEVLIERPTAA